MILSNFNFQQFKTLSVLQFSTDGQDIMDYVSGTNAIQEKNVNVSEISESGNVNTLIVENNLDKMIFFSDGDILSGAKQNRVLNISILLPAKSKTLVPVSCIERGRWHYRSKTFYDTDYSAYKDLRVRKHQAVKENLKKNKIFMANQGEVWNEISNMYCEFKENSETDNLSDLYEKKSIDINEFLNQFICVKESNGIAFFVCNKLQSIDIFGRKDIYESYFPKLIRGIGFSALSLKYKSDIRLDLSLTLVKVKSLFEDIYKNKYEQYDSIGLGYTKTFENQNFSGFELSYNSSSIHIALLSLRRS